LNSEKKINELIRSVADETSLSEEQSAAAVSSTLRYLKARLSSRVVGELQEVLYNELTASRTTSDQQRSKE